jgi:hypothetical protein
MGNQIQARRDNPERSQLTLSPAKWIRCGDELGRDEMTWDVTRRSTVRRDELEHDESNSRAAGELNIQPAVRIRARRDDSGRGAAIWSLTS